MLFRGVTLALLGLSSLVQAAPLSRRQATFTIGDPLPADAATAIAELEVDLEQLQNLPYRNRLQLQEEGALKAILFYTYGITSISAPDGTSTTLTISSRKRQNTFVFGSDLPNQEAEAIDELQIDLEQLQDLAFKTRADWELIGAIRALLFYQYGITYEYAPPGTSTTLTPGKRQESFNLGGSLPSDETEAIKELEVALEQLQDKPNKSYADYELIGAIKGLLLYTYHVTSISAPPGTTSTFTPGKRQESFTLGGSLPSDETEAIKELEVALEQLQDKPNKSYADYELIGAIKGLLLYTYHVTSISAPPGTTSTFTPGKRQESFNLGGSLPSDETEAIKELEVALEQLQDKPNKSYADYELIGAIKGLLLYTYHVTSISAPPGTTSTFTPGRKL